MNCHLAHGKANTQKRFEEIKTIYSAVLGSTSEKQVQSHDVKFMFGDLNFRIEMDNASTCQLLRDKHYDILLKNDQLLSQSKYCSYLPSLNEAPIRFPPTYKFVKNTCCYDTEKRPPAWCDRILWGAADAVRCLDYASVDSLGFSDHKPVHGVYLVKIKKVVGNEKEEAKNSSTLDSISESAKTSPSKCFIPKIIGAVARKENKRSKEIMQFFGADAKPGPKTT